MIFFLTEIGVGLAGFGIAFLFLGVLLIFDKGLLAIGNVSYFVYLKNIEVKTILYLSI